MSEPRPGRMAFTSRGYGEGGAAFVPEERRSGERRVRDRGIRPGCDAGEEGGMGCICSRRHGSDRRRTKASEEDARARAGEGGVAASVGSLVDIVRPRVIETEDGPQDLGEHYESIYILAEAIVEGFDFEQGDALGMAIDMVNRYELTSHLRTEATRP